MIRAYKDYTSNPPLIITGTGFSIPIETHKMAALVDDYLMK